MAKVTKQISFICRSCRNRTQQYTVKCPYCKETNSLVEDILEYEDELEDVFGFRLSSTPPVPITEIEATPTEWIPTCYEEIDDVFGGGLPRRGAVILAGRGGSGKSTLCLQISDTVSRQANKRVLYVSVEESVEQIKAKCMKMGITLDRMEDRFLLVNEPNLTKMIEYMDNQKPDLIIIDSIQMVIDPSMVGQHGGINMTKQACNKLVRYVKFATYQPALLLISQQTKSGSIAGSEMLTHVVDVVTRVEYDEITDVRGMHLSKNRFGPIGKSVLMKMTGYGLIPVKRGLDEVVLFKHAPGVAYSVVLDKKEGLTHFAEIQTSCTPVEKNGKVVVDGLNRNRVTLVAKIVDNLLNLDLTSYNLLVKGRSPMKSLSKESDLDLAIAISIISARLDKPVVGKTVFTGELDLDGQLRPSTDIVEQLFFGASFGIDNFYTSNMSKFYLERIDETSAKDEVMASFKLLRLQDRLQQVPEFCFKEQAAQPKPDVKALREQLHAHRSPEAPLAPQQPDPDALANRKTDVVFGPSHDIIGFKPVAERPQPQARQEPPIQPVGPSSSPAPAGFKVVIAQ